MTKCNNGSKNVNKQTTKLSIFISCLSHKLQASQVPQIKACLWSLTLIFTNQTPIAPIIMSSLHKPQLTMTGLYGFIREHSHSMAVQIKGTLGHVNRGSESFSLSPSAPLTIRIFFIFKVPSPVLLNCSWSLFGGMLT